MSTYNAFDHAELGSKKGAQKPFWTLDFEKEKELLEWLNAEYEFRVDQAQDRILTQKKNLAAYRGIQYQAQDTRSREVEATVPGRKNQRIVINHMIDMVEQDVARLTKYRGAVSAVPPSQDWDDRIVAGIAEDLIEAKWEKEEIDFLYQKLHRRKRIMGEDFLLVLWNPDLGHYHPDYVAEVFKRCGISKDPKKLSKGEIRDIFRKEIKEIPRLPLLDPKTGRQMTNSGGDLMWIDKPVRVGDVAYKLCMSWDMFLERRSNYEDVDNGFYRESEHVDDVRADHPEKADKIQPDSDYRWFDPETLEDQDMTNRTEVKHFFHRSTNKLGQGRYVKFTKDAILINKPNNYVGPDGAILPWERISDIMSPGVLNGESFVTHGRPAQAIYNQVISMRARNQFLFAHPKWFYDKGSIKVESLGNDTSMVAKAPGSAEPKLVQPQIASSEQSALRTEAKEDLQQMMGVYSVSRGEVPTGVTAASALMFLDEQESERANPGVAAHTRHQRMVALRTLWLMADYYDDTDGRLEDLLGKTRAYEVKNFKMADLTRISDLRIQNSSALPQQKSAKMQYVKDVKDTWPNILADDQVVDILGLGDVDKFQNTITVAIRAAEGENDTMIRTGKAPDPKEWENHLTHYRVHMKSMNDPSFKSMPPRIHNAFEDHVAATEMLMTKVMTRNPVFAQMVIQEFPQFPVFYEEGALAAPMPLEGVGAGAVAAGNELAFGGPAAPPPALPPSDVPPGFEAQMPVVQPGSPGAGLESTLGAQANV